jgi:hypothetical protein
MCKEEIESEWWSNSGQMAEDKETIDRIEVEFRSNCESSTSKFFWMNPPPIDHHVVVKQLSTCASWLEIWLNQGQISVK